MYTSDNDNRLFYLPWNEPHLPHNLWYEAMWPYYSDCNYLLLCPMTKKPLAMMTHTGLIKGTKFRDWGTWCLIDFDKPASIIIYGSYGLNNYVMYYGREWPPPPPPSCFWRTCLIKGVDNIPAFMDSVYPFATAFYECPLPPEYEGIWGPKSKCWACVNRHDGGINMLFMDWSVRKVGLKELWTLKWHKEFNTHNPWTKAGSVKPEDWPEWMRQFRAY